MINLREFLNTADELHALVIGLAEVICPWPPRHPLMNDDYAQTFRKEYHYYQLGRAAGVIIIIIIIIIIIMLFF